MKIFLMRHGHAPANMDDTTRPLSIKGRRQAERAGEFLRKIDEVPDIILHSPFTRARMTAEHVAIAAGIDEQTLQQRDGLEPEDDASVFLDTLISEFVVPDQKILLVGHEPFMSTLAQLLITGDQVNLSLNFGRGALLGTESLGQGVGRIWQLRFYLTAENLTRLIWLPD